MYLVPFLYIVIVIPLFLLSKKFDLIDYPNERKKHSVPTPLIGGVTIFIIFYSYVFIYESNEKILFLVISSTPIFIVSLIDDFKDISSKLRLSVQALCATLIIIYGIKIESIGYAENLNLEIGIFSLFLTFFSIIIFTNAFNFIDGNDGLSSGYALTFIFGLIGYSYFFGNPITNYSFYVLFILLICFFIQNFFFSTKKIFLGDSGSNTIGFILAGYAIFFSSSNYMHFQPQLAIWPTALVIYDFTYLFIKRISESKNPMQAGNDHIHHSLLNYFSKKIVTLLLIVLSLFFIIAGFLINKYFNIYFNFSIFIIFFIFYFLIRDQILK